MSTPDELRQQQSLLASMTPPQRKVWQEFFYPGYGIEQKSGCFSGKTETKTMTAQEYMHFVRSRVEHLKIKNKALGKLGIDEDQVTEIAPVEFRGFKHTDVTQYKERCSNLYEVTWLFFSADQLYAYSILLDMVSDSVKERTEEYFYKDVTNFSSATDSIEKLEQVANFTKGGCMKPDETTYTHKKTILETSIFKIVVPGESFTCEMEATGEIEKRIQGMKQKLREKKA